ncbi:hypothetical protein N0V95_004496 [Ascochyta clinopodiicola]|nr:hypothetical protein N0V95_004496 [Ascochyta clinopodiicola]
MAPVPYSQNVRLDTTHEYRTRNDHFIDATRTPACDHCAYFKGFVHRSIHEPADNDRLLVKRYNNLARGPRSLHNIAVEEERIEARDHADYMAWSRSRYTSAAAAVAADATHETEKAVVSNGLYAKESDTLTTWIEESTKEELLSWIERNGNEKDDIEALRHEGIFDLRKYMMHRRTKKPASKAKAQKSTATTQHTSSPAHNKTPDPRADATARRIQAYTSVKPPQAARRQREELTRWYDAMKTPLLKDELRKRGVKPVPSRKVDVIALLVENDKKGV